MLQIHIPEEIKIEHPLLASGSPADLSTDPRRPQFHSCLDNGKLIRKYVERKTRHKVVESLQALKQKHDSGSVLPSKKRTVAHFLDEWLTVHVKGTKVYSTNRGYEQVSRLYLIPNLGSITLDRLSGKDVQKLLNKMSNEGLSPTTVKNINAVLKTALTIAKRWGYVDRNAAKDATPPKQVKFNPSPLTAEQGIKLLNVVVNHRYEAVFYVAMLQGLRRGEVVGLQWTDIDDQTNTLHVRHGVQRVKGEGDVMVGVKSEASERKIPLLSVVAAALRRRRERQNEERVAAGEHWTLDGEFVFTSRDGNRIMPEEPIRELKAALKLAGLPDIRFHDLRHSTAVILQALGVDLKTIQVILGHSNFQITADFYAQGVSSEVTAATQKLNDRFEKHLLASTPKTDTNIGVAAATVGVNVGIGERVTIQ